MHDEQNVLQAAATETSIAIKGSLQGERVLKQLLRQPSVIQEFEGKVRED